MRPRSTTLTAISIQLTVPKNFIILSNFEFLFKNQVATSELENFHFNYKGQQSFSFLFSWSYCYFLKTEVFPKNCLFKYHKWSFPLILYVRSQAFSKYFQKIFQKKKNFQKSLSFMDRFRNLTSTQTFRECTCVL